MQNLRSRSWQGCSPMHQFWTTSTRQSRSLCRSKSATSRLPAFSTCMRVSSCSHGSTSALENAHLPNMTTPCRMGSSWASLRLLSNGTTTLWEGMIRSSYIGLINTSNISKRQKYNPRDQRDGWRSSLCMTLLAKTWKARTIQQMDHREDPTMRTAMTIWWHRSWPFSQQPPWPNHMMTFYRKSKQHRTPTF